MTTLVDSNILIDLLEEHPDWLDWSERQLTLAAGDGPLLIGDVIYAEVSVRFPTQPFFDSFLAELGIKRVPIREAALFLAARAHNAYRAAGGSRPGVLPDFFIGAQAAMLGLPLLTRDVRRYRTYFPTIRLICPESGATPGAAWGTSVAGQHS